MLPYINGVCSRTYGFFILIMILDCEIQPIFIILIDSVVTTVAFQYDKQQVNSHYDEIPS